MIAVFNRSNDCISFVSEHDLYHQYACFPASNNAARNSKGRWPEGVYEVDTLIRVTGEDADQNGKYGRWFLRAKDFGDRTGMGIHAGRRTKTDLAGRSGVRHATMGCIRSIDEALQYVVDHWDHDKVTKIVVVN